MSPEELAAEARALAAMSRVAWGCMGMGMDDYAERLRAGRGDLDALRRLGKQREDAKAAGLPKGDYGAKPAHPSARDLRALAEASTKLALHAKRAGICASLAEGDVHLVTDPEQAARDALGTLSLLMSDPDPVMRAGAAKSVLDGLAATREDDQLVTRLREAVERAVTDPEARQRLADALDGG